MTIKMKTYRNLWNTVFQIQLQFRFHVFGQIVDEVVSFVRLVSNQTTVMCVRQGTLIMNYNCLIQYPVRFVSLGRLLLLLATCNA